MRLLLATMFLTACVSALPPGPPDPAISPETFFVGVACGRGVLTGAGGAPKDRFVVTSRGERAGDGIVLDQAVRMADGEVRRRRWAMRPDGARSYAGTLEGPNGLGATGAVRVEVAGGVMRIRYAVSGTPLARMEQHLYLQGDGSVMNVGTVRVAGVPVRRLHERIEPQPGVATDAPNPCSLEANEGD